MHLNSSHVFSSLSFHTRTLGSNFLRRLFVALNRISITNSLCIQPVPENWQNHSEFKRGKRWWGFGMQWHQLDYMQTMCTSLETDNHTNTSWLLQAGCSSWCPAVKALKADTTHTALLKKTIQSICFPHALNGHLSSECGLPNPSSGFFLYLFY